MKCKLSQEELDEIMEKWKEIELTIPQYKYAFCAGIPFSDEEVIGAFKNQGGVIVVDRHNNKWLCGERYEEEKE